MNKRKNVLNKPLQSEQDFSVFLKRVREESGVLGEELVEGLMDISQLSRIESELRPVLKTMRNRLLGRLGVTPDKYENLLNNEDYAEWEWQHKILWAIERKDFQEAKRLIGEYEMREPTGDKIKRQFCLVMQAELLKLQGGERSEIASCYEKAVRLTVPEVEQVYAKPKLLSVLEVNIVLEYECYREPKSGFSTKCRFWMDYVTDSLYDDLSMAKIYPKIVYYYLREIFNNNHTIALSDLQQYLQLCDDMVELLRNTGRAFYLVELLEYKGKVLEDLIGQLAGSGSENKAERYQAALKESAELEKLLKKLYAEYDVLVYMQDCTYLYQQRWVFAIGDVLRIRRNMLGLTQEEVCDGICSVKSLRRAEQRKMNMQREPLGKILRRLGLSKEIQKTTIVTNDRRVMQLMTEMAFCRNNYEVGKARMLLERLKVKVCLEIPENQQYMMEAEASLDLMEGKITVKEFVIKVEAALQCTLNTERFCYTDETYLTEMEMTCIRQRIQGLDKEDKRKQIDFLLHFFQRVEKENKISDYIAMYEFVMVCVTSELGNMGEFQFASELDKKVLRELLNCRRLYEIHSLIYDILWNDKEQRLTVGKMIEKEKMTDGLRQCIILSHFCKRTFKEKFYYNKINQLEHAEE
ncbi:MAG: helix-turn-helix transcriptional regulator [Lachnospiraceae bacterium]|nr:helix-turn-helix transcriptional regulator [Lachnospiraceae bacterium]